MRHGGARRRGPSVRVRVRVKVRVKVRVRARVRPWSRVESP